MDAVQLYTVPTAPPLKLTTAISDPLHTTWLDGWSIAVEGEFTVIVKVSAVPMHPLTVGVTVMVAVTADVPLLIAVNEAILPVPLAGSPMEGVLFVQL